MKGRGGREGEGCKDKELKALEGMGGGGRGWEEEREIK